MSANYLRYPDVHGDEVVFVADDDLWLAPLGGGKAWRLTNDQAPVAYPTFSPDGSKIAWNSTVDGTGDTYLLDRESGSVRRLTYWNASVLLARVVGWLDDEHVIVACPDDGHHGLDVRLRSIGLDGSSQRLPYGTAMGLATHPSGAVAITTPNWRDLSAWKRYRGGTAPKIWLDAAGDGEWQRVLPDETAGCYSPGFFGDRLFFASDIGELAEMPQSQLYSVDLAGTDLRRHTNHDGDSGYVRDPATDGTTIVYHARGVLYAMTGLDAEPRPIEIDLPTRRRRVRVADVTTVGALQPDQGADGSVLEWRGAAYYLTHRGGPARALCDVPGVRVREVCLLGDTGEVAYVRDDDNIDQIEIRRLDGTGEARRLDASNLGYLVSLVATPSGDALGVVSHDGRVSLVDVAGGQITTVQQTSNGEPLHPTFSPDGRYLAWRDPRGGEGEHGAIRVCDRQAGHEVFDLTSGLFNDSSPAFSTDGKYLVFLSDRIFDPVYNSHDFDLSFGDSTRPYLVPLGAEEPVPFGPTAAGWPISEVVRAAAAEAGDQPGEDASEEDKQPKVTCQIDREGLFERAVALPVPVGNISQLRAAKDGVLWLHEPPTAGELGQARAGVDEPAPRARLERYSFTARKLETIVEQLDSYRVSGAGAHIVYRDEGQLFVAPADRKVEEKDPMLVSIDTSRLRRDIDLLAEWGQMLRETHRLMRDNFWRPDLDGVDWDAMLARYAPVVARAASRDDVVDISWEMVGELNTGHAYIRPEKREPSERQAGRLGADLRRESDGSYLIELILPGEPSDPRASSPLLAAGVAARPGDRIVAVNGHRLGPDNTLGELLAGSADKVVELVLSRAGAERAVAVVPIASEAGLRYHAWVASRRAYVDQHSDGRLGYVHIPDMAAEGWAQFYRDIHTATKREGLVVDVRFNGGGHTSQLIIEKLARNVLGWDVSRWYTEPTPYPSDAIRGSLVLVTNQFAGSDGDIVNAAAQELGLGPVIGERTWGGVIGIDGRYPLVDGAVVTQPRYAFHFNTAGWDVENHGVDPDIEVIMSPADWDDTEVDVQLDAAIAESFRQLEKRPAMRPPDGFPPPRVG